MNTNAVSFSVLLRHNNIRVVDHKQCNLKGGGLMLKKKYSQLGSSFKADYAIFWSDLSRLNNLLVVMNISMIFIKRTRGSLLVYGLPSLTLFASHLSLYSCLNVLDIRAMMAYVCRNTKGHFLFSICLLICSGPMKNGRFS